ncbi:MAG TPA: hypothetical protein VGJ81_14430 [Thermoanaerobaculia bacterium]|jgi:hypothetical protein
MMKKYPSKRAAALIHQAIGILEHAEDAPVDLERITFELARVVKNEGAAVATTFDAIYRETEAEAKLQGPGSEAARRLQLIPLLVTAASKSGSRNRRQKGSPTAKPPLSSHPRLQLLFELTAVKLLDSLPAKEPVIAIPAEESGSGQERVLLRIGVRQFAWVGSFVRGNKEASTAHLMPDGHLLVSACGAGYILDRTSHALIEKIGDDVMPVGLDDSGSLFIVAHDEKIIECFGPRGRLWKTAPIGCGGFRGLTITGDELLGEARRQSEQEWTPFAVKLGTGKVVQRAGATLGDGPNSRRPRNQK